VSEEPDHLHVCHSKQTHLQVETLRIYDGLSFSSVRASLPASRGGNRPGSVFTRKSNTPMSAVSVSSRLFWAKLQGEDRLAKVGEVEKDPELVEQERLLVYPGSA